MPGGAGPELWPLWEAEPRLSAGRWRKEAGGASASMSVPPSVHLAGLSERPPPPAPLAARSLSAQGPGPPGSAVDQ